MVLRDNIVLWGAQIYGRGQSQAVDGRLVAALQALHGGTEDAEAYAKAVVSTRCREVHTALPATNSAAECSGESRAPKTC